jgi:hypothetical protein
MTEKNTNGIGDLVLNLYKGFETFEKGGKDANYESAVNGIVDGLSGLYKSHEDAFYAAAGVMLLGMVDRKAAEDLVKGIAYKFAAKSDYVPKDILPGYNGQDK